MKTQIKLKFVQFANFIVNQLISRKSVSADVILVIAPHPDDEVIGLGGLIVQQKQAGREVHLLFLTDGEASGSYTDSDEIKRQRMQLTEQVCKQLDIPTDCIHRLHLADGAVPHKNHQGFDDIAQIITMLIDRIQPDQVFATSATDYWPYDHVACSQLATEAVVRSATKPQLWFYWVWAWYNLRPLSLLKLNFKHIYKIDISQQLAAKQQLMDMYLKPLSPEGKPWSGVLPRAMIYPFGKPVEIVERCDPPNPQP